MKAKKNQKALRAACSEAKLCPLIRGELTCVLKERHAGAHRTYDGKEWS